MNNLLILSIFCISLLIVPKIWAQERGKIYRTDQADSLATFPGGADSLIEFISNNLTLPRELRKQIKKSDITINIGFVVTDEGFLSDIYHIPYADSCKNEVKGYKESVVEALRLFELMPLWKPATKDEKAINVYHTIPIRVSLFQKIIDKEIKFPEPDYSLIIRKYGDEALPLVSAKQIILGLGRQKEERPYTTLHYMPSFKGGQKAMYKFIYDNLRHPNPDQGVQGKVTLRFVIASTGDVTDIEVRRGVDPELDKEAIRVIEMMPKWIPGMQENVCVNTFFNLQVVFRFRD